MTKEQIQILKSDIQDLGQRIKSSDQLITSLTDPELKKLYYSQLLPLIDAYYDLDLLLKKSLRDYISGEDKVIDFTLRRLRKEINKK